jgi:hypothetical protein
MNYFKIGGIIFMTIGIGLFIGLIISIITTIAFIAGSMKTTGQIIKIVKTTTDVTTSRKHFSRSTQTNFFPVVRFRDMKGETIEFQSHFSDGRAARIGEQVEVRFSPENPSHSRISSMFMDLWGVSVFMGLFSSAALLFGIIFIGM